MNEHICDHQDEDAQPTFLMKNEHGKDVSMILVEKFSVLNHTYALLLDKNSLDKDGVIVRMEEEGEEIVLCNIEDEEEWIRVEKAYYACATH